MIGYDMGYTYVYAMIYWIPVHMYILYTSVWVQHIDVALLDHP